MRIIYIVFTILSVFIHAFCEKIETSNAIKPAIDSVAKPESKDSTQLKHAHLVGSRSRASIMSVVMKNLPGIKMIYNQRLKKEPGIGGKITVKYAIDEFGNVIFCEVFESTMNNPWMETNLVALIKQWKFKNIGIPGDVTEIVYPFIFAPPTYSAQMPFSIITIVICTMLLSFLIITQS